MEDASDNPEKMLYNELLASTFHSSYNSVRTKDHCALQIRSNHGIGIITSLFGCESSIFNNEMPWISHISLEDAKKAFASGVPDFNRALGKKVIDTYHYYHDRREALGVITETYIRFREFVDPLLTDSCNDDTVFVHGFLCGGALHYCGLERDWHYEEMSDKNLHAINFGNPEMHSLEKAYNFWKQRHVAIVGWEVNDGLDHFNELQEPVGSACAERGLHIMMEKPIAPTVEAAEELIHSANVNNVKLLIAHHRRFNPMVVATRDMIRNGDLGEIVGISILWCMYKPKEYFEVSPWRKHKGGGPILINPSMLACPKASHRSAVLIQPSHDSPKTKRPWQK